MSEFGPANKLTCPDDDSDEEDANAMEERPPRLKSLDEAISCLGGICDFVLYQGSKQLKYSRSLG